MNGPAIAILGFRTVEYADESGRRRLMHVSCSASRQPWSSVIRRWALSTLSIAPSACRLHGLHNPARRLVLRGPSFGLQGLGYPAGLSVPRVLSLLWITSYRYLGAASAGAARKMRRA